MATTSNYNEIYLKYASASEEKPTEMPVLGGAIPEGTFLYDISTGDLYAYSAGSWVAQ